MNDVITVEVAGKFGPKVNGKWLGVKRPLKASDFVAGTSYEVELEPWNKNGKSGTNVVSMKLVEKQRVEEKAKEVDTPTVTSSSTVKGSYEDYNTKKDRRILVQGITQAVASSPSLAGLPFTNQTEVVANIKAVAKELIEFVLEQTK